MRTARAGVSVETFSVAKTASFFVQRNCHIRNSCDALSQTIPALHMVPFVSIRSISQVQLCRGAARSFHGEVDFVVGATYAITMNPIL